MKYFHHCLTIDHRYLYVPFTCLALHYEEMKSRFLLVVLTFLAERWWLRFSTQKAQLAFPAGVKDLNKRRH